MGSSYTKDENIDLYIYNNKQYYVAGQYVEGQVYLNAKTTRNYSNICIKIEGEEYVYWSEGSGKNRRSYSNRHKSYNAHILLVDFHGTVNQGQYRFPFSFLLPSMMSGSFIYSQSCYIKYLLRVQLVHPTEEKQSQVYQMHLNILEPPRMPIGALSLTNTVNSKCCHCCSDYGNTIVSLNCSKNFVLNGDSVAIKGFVNNSQGKQNIKSFKIQLEERVIMISSGGRTRSRVHAEYPMLENQQGVPAGTNKQYAINTTIPNQIVHYTAIGTIVARYFVLHLTTEYGCCANTAEAFLHLILHSRTPMIVEKKQMPIPQNWYPKEFPKISCTTLTPFSYVPLRQIPFLNMPGSQNITMQMGADSKGYPSLYDQYQQPTSDFKPMVDPSQFLNYAPTYYNENMFTESEQYQQGYKGQQPYFNNDQNSQSNLIKKI